MYFNRPKHSYLSTYICSMKTILFTTLIITTNSLFAGSPWTPKKKSGFFQVQATIPFGTTTSLFLENGNTLNINRETLDFTFQAHLEYGLTDKLALVTNLPYKFIATKDATNITSTQPLLTEGSLNGFSNYQLALKYQFLDQSLKGAFSVKSSFNNVTRDLEKGLATGIASNSIGVFAHFGKSFSEKWYAILEGGVNKRLNNFSDNMNIHFELGYQLKPSLWATGVIDVVESFKNGSFINENLRQTGFWKSVV